MSDTFENLLDELRSGVLVYKVQYYKSEAKRGPPKKTLLFADIDSVYWAITDAKATVTPVIIKKDSESYEVALSNDNISRTSNDHVDVCNRRVRQALNGQEENPIN